MNLSVLLIYNSLIQAVWMIFSNTKILNPSINSMRTSLRPQFLVLERIKMSMRFPRYRLHSKNLRSSSNSLSASAMPP
jgi:hypothetical protein